MANEPIEEFLRQSESQVFERKKSLGLQRDGLESLCAMINADAAQGTVVFGIARDGQLVGVEPGDLDRAQQSLSQAMTAKFAPRPQCEIRVIEFEGKRFVLLSAERNRNVPYYEFDGRAFIREGTVTRQLTLAERQSLQIQRSRDLHNGPWRCDRCGSWTATLGSVVVTDQGAHKSYSCDCGGEYWPAR